MIISAEEWKESLTRNFQASQSKYWREFAWKVSMRYFITPHTVSKGNVSPYMGLVAGEDVGIK